MHGRRCGATKLRIQSAKQSACKATVDMAQECTTCQRNNCTVNTCRLHYLDSIKLHRSIEGHDRKHDYLQPTSMVVAESPQRYHMVNVNMVQLYTAPSHGIPHLTTKAVRYGARCVASGIASLKANHGQPLGKGKTYLTCTV